MSAKMTRVSAACLQHILLPCQEKYVIAKIKENSGVQSLPGFRGCDIVGQAGA